MFTGGTIWILTHGHFLPISGSFLENLRKPRETAGRKERRLETDRFRTGKENGPLPAPGAATSAPRCGDLQALLRFLKAPTQALALLFSDPGKKGTLFGKTIFSGAATKKRKNSWCH